MGKNKEGGVRVIHRHRIGQRPAFVRVSELSFNGRHPVAILSWLNEGALRTPGVCVELDPAKLHSGAGRRLWMYEGETTDPRF